MRSEIVLSSRKQMHRPHKRVAFTAAARKAEYLVGPKPYRKLYRHLEVDTCAYILPKVGIDTAKLTTAMLREGQNGITLARHDCGRTRAQFGNIDPKVRTWLGPSGNASDAQIAVSLLSGPAQSCVARGTHRPD